MTPGAHIAAAIEVLDQILAGKNAEVSLIKWGRSNRFAGSGDRYAIRDIDPRILFPWQFRSSDYQEHL